MFLLTLVLAQVNARVSMPSFFSDNMVLQQQSDITLTGCAAKNTEVRITTSWNGKSISVDSDAEGRWTAHIETPKAGGSYEITISDGQELKLENILIGEVWFCSGQSNMEMPVKGFDGQAVDYSDEYIMKAKPSTPIRMFIADSKDGQWIRQYSKTPQEDCKGEWLEHTPENVGNTSATAYFFAHYLQEVLDVPVGIIVSSRGGSNIESWMSSKSLSKYEDIDLSILDNEEKITNDTSTPSVLYNVKLAPFHNYKIKGFLWYQGESNRNNVGQYKSLMHSFVNDVRTLWKDKELPFYFVEIAPFNYEGPNGTSGAKMREVQQQCMLEIDHCSMVSTLDIGHPTIIHPNQKTTVGKRLALQALSRTYGMKGLDYKTPVYKSMKVKDGKAYIYVQNLDRALYPILTELEEFEIAGADKVFHTAKARIDDKNFKRIVVYSPEVAEPVAVRYAFKNYPKASVFSTNLIPLGSFRTDSWEL